MDVVILCGLSGAGKSVATRALEDIGYYCIDHLRSEVLQPSLRALQTKGYQRVAIGLEIHDHALIKDAQTKWKELETLGFNVTVIILTARSDVLQRRYFETRRPHPLSHQGLSTEQAIEQEIRALRLMPRGWHVVDTSDMKASDLSKWVQQYVHGSSHPMTVVLQSFGFKHGAPTDCDMVFDARCLPNPYYDVSLRPLTGNDAPVIEFFEQHPIVQDFVNDLYLWVTKWYTTYENDQRKCWHIGIGCTGGQHRSVYSVNLLTQKLTNSTLPVRTLHREKSRWAAHE